MTVASAMPTLFTSKPLARRDSVSEPLRRSLVKPAVAANPARRRRMLNGLLVFATVVFLVDALVGNTGLMERLRVGRQYQEQAGSLSRLRSENAALREKARRLREDPAVYEWIARKELGLMKPGEILFIIHDAKPPSGR